MEPTQQQILDFSRRLSEIGVDHNLAVLPDGGGHKIGGILHIPDVTAFVDLCRERGITVSYHAGTGWGFGGGYGRWEPN